MELKLDLVRRHLYGLQDYQSYLSGIKTQDEIKDIGGFVAINRTLVELKQKTDAFGYQERYAINRTLVELKPSTASPLLRIAYLSIVP